MDIVVVGLGKVGLVLGVALASAGHRVSGIDVDPARVASINDRSIRTQEPGIESRLRALSDLDFVATADMSVVADADAVFIIVPTPSTEGGGFSLDYVLAAVDAIGPGLRDSSRDPVVSLVSTVMPGSSEDVIIPRLESAVGRKIGDRLGYGYNPAFIALGEVLQGFVTPDLVLIGEAGEGSGDVLARIHASMVPMRTPIVRLTTAEAEIAKLASNAHESMRVSFVNMLLAACQQVPNADVDAITEALTFRHGQRLFRGAVPYGGPCWPRDNFALSAFLSSVGAPSQLPAAVHLANDEHAEFLLRTIRSSLSEGAQTVTVAGLAYKPGTDVLDESFGLWLANRLADDDALIVRGWDPLAAGAAARVAAPGVAVFSDFGAALDGTDVLIITLPLKELLAFDWAQAPDGIAVIDCWRVLRPIPHVLRSRYRGLGSSVTFGSDEAASGHGAQLL